MERLFGSQIKIGEIFPMNGKKGVEKAFEEYGNSYENKPAIYIVDADFDIVMEKEMIQDENYIYLEKYNIESYFVDKRATIKYMARKLKKRQKEVKEIINYQMWESNTYKEGKFALTLNYKFNDLFEIL